MNGMEIEHKFLIQADEHGKPIKEFAWDLIRHGIMKAEIISQCFLSTDPNKVIRIRLVKEDVSIKGWFYRLKYWLKLNKSSWNDKRWSHALLTVKGKADGPARQEIETVIDLKTALDLFKFFSEGVINKTRFTVDIHGDIWEVDCLQFPNTPYVLWLAEIELQDPAQLVELPLSSTTPSIIMGTPVLLRW